ncbi:Fungal-trans domain-containing protein [Mycena kentingensis (nom. inval.)]|nr:Fungal-trans domain-containing protein [Mycena kentingensis (nom. inval.)]
MNAESVVPGSKRRRLRGSCNFCKQRKIKCDSSQMPGNRCSNCISFNMECLHDSSSRAAPKQDRSPPVQAPTETKSAKEHVAAILVQATSYIKDEDVRHVLLDVARYARSLEGQASGRAPTDPTNSPNALASPAQLKIKDETEDLYTDGLLAERFDRFRLDSDSPRYYGKSSHFELINTAMDIKENLVKPQEQLPPVKRQQFWMSPWEHEHLSKEEPFRELHFPDPDLLHSLVKLYFDRVNIVINLLHRPIFERAIAAGTHHTDHHFGETVLAVCAIAAKFSDDPRCILDGTNSRLSSGWQWYRQIRPYQKSLVRSITLHEAQTLCLAVIYIQGGSTPDMCWGLGGAGIRFVQEVGVHRKNRYENDRVLSEQWKRVWWVLLCIDTLVSGFCGRPRATRSHDYDVDLPAECDDEYWETEDPEQAFKQPPGRPSLTAGMNAYLRLIEILGMAQESIYLVDAKNRSIEWMREAVANIDSALNDWADKIPDHLRWDPHREDPLFATQSATLYACYYHVQIQVHRIFIVCPNPGLDSAPMATALTYNYPSLSICASSARACSHIMDVASRKGLLCNPHVLNAIFDSGIILLLNVWGGRKVGLAVDPKKCLQDLDICLRVFRVYEQRWQVAGRQHDILMELMNAATMDPAFGFTPNPLKRARVDVDVDAERAQDQAQLQTQHRHQHQHQRNAAPSYDPSPFNTNANVNFTPESSLSPDTGSGSSLSPELDILGFDTDALFALPMTTEDLGKLPLYEPFGAGWGGDMTGPDSGGVDHSLFAAMNQQMPVATGPAFMEQSDAAGSTSANSQLQADALSVLPHGYDWDEWGKYITTVEEFMTAMGAPPPPAGHEHIQPPSYSML